MGKPHRIVVSGGAGFIGTHTVARLVKAGDTVLVAREEERTSTRGSSPGPSFKPFSTSLDTTD